MSFKSQFALISLFLAGLLSSAGHAQCELARLSPRNAVPDLAFGIRFDIEGDTAVVSAHESAPASVRAHEPRPSAVSSVVPTTKANDGPSEQNVTFYLGERSFNEDAYWPVDDHGVLGVEFSDEPAGSPIGYEIGLQFSCDDAGAIEASSAELYGGVHKNFGSGRLRPVLGAGLSLIGVSFEVGSAEDHDASLAGYAHAGLGFRVGSNITLGADTRFLFGSDIELDDEDEADYSQIALTLGIGL